jgi:hypothetical protein
VIPFFTTGPASGSASITKQALKNAQDFLKEILKNFRFPV